MVDNRRWERTRPSGYVWNKCGCGLRVHDSNCVINRQLVWFWPRQATFFPIVNLLHLLTSLQVGTWPSWLIKWSELVFLHHIPDKGKFLCFALLFSYRTICNKQKRPFSIHLFPTDNPNGFCFGFVKLIRAIAKTSTFLFLNRYLGLEAPESRTTNILAKPPRKTHYVPYDTETDREKEQTRRSNLLRRLERFVMGLAWMCRPYQKSI